LSSKKCPSRAKIARWVKRCAEAAGRTLGRLDKACRGLVQTGCFDEIFFHGKPVLVGVEPQSMAWVIGQHAADRSGKTWSEALEGFDALEQATVDGGRGLQRDLDDFQAKRNREGNASDGSGRWLATTVVQTEYCRKLKPNWEESYRKVAAVLRQTVRASSAVECINSVLRMHHARHRTVTQPMLDLKRLYWNCRPFRSRKRRGRCPYELLGLRLSIPDRWRPLHTAPADLMQELSSSQVTI
jgi:hypothetical protein